MAKKKEEISKDNVSGADKLKSLRAALDKINKEHGSGTVMMMGESHSANVEVIPTGSIGLDAALGAGGFPRGRIIEIYGPEASGKSTLAQFVIAESQKKGGICAYIDAEHALSIDYLKGIGVNVDNLILNQPDHGEQALQIAEDLIETNSIDVIVIDSVAALTPKAEIEGEMGDNKIGLQARLMSQALRKLTAKVAKSKTCLIFINQLREKIGIMFGTPETTTGGNALKFYASVRIDVRKKDKLSDPDGNVIGHRTKLKIVKNKVGPPFREAEYNLIFGKGVDKMAELIFYATQYDIIKKAGAWYSYEGTQLGMGEDKTKKMLEDNPELYEKILQEVKQKVYGTIKTFTPSEEEILESSMNEDDIV